MSESSEGTPSAVGSHHVEEEEEVVAPAPAIPVNFYLQLLKSYQLSCDSD